MSGRGRQGKAGRQGGNEQDEKGPSAHGGKDSRGAVTTGQVGRPGRRQELIAALGEDPIDFDPRRLDKEISRLRQKVQAETGFDLPVQTMTPLRCSLAL